MNHRYKTDTNDFSNECVCYNYQKCALKTGNIEDRKCEMKIPNSNKCPLYQNATNLFGKCESELEERVIN